METIYNIDPAVFAAAEFNAEREVEDDAGDELSFKEMLVKTTSKTPAKAQRVAKEAKTKVARVTKSMRAAELYKQHNGNKAAVIESYMTELNMSKAGATTYFYTAKKAA
jgi:hypothetical protein